MSYSKDKTIMKTIRVSPAENENWDINKIHDFLSGLVSSNDSIEINKLKRVLKVYHLLFEQNLDYIIKNKSMKDFIMNHDEFNQLEEVL